MQDLVCKNILIENIPEAKQSSYSIVFAAENLTLFLYRCTCCFRERHTILNSMFKGHRKITERVLPLDAECYQNDICP